MSEPVDEYYETLKIRALAWMESRPMIAWECGGPRCLVCGDRGNVYLSDGVVSFGAGHACLATEIEARQKARAK